MAHRFPPTILANTSTYWEQMRSYQIIYNTVQDEINNLIQRNMTIDQNDIVPPQLMRDGVWTLPASADSPQPLITGTRGEMEVGGANTMGEIYYHNYMDTWPTSEQLGSDIAERLPDGRVGIRRLGPHDRLGETISTPYVAGVDPYRIETNIPEATPEMQAQAAQMEAQVLRTPGRRSGRSMHNMPIGNLSNENEIRLSSGSTDWTYAFNQNGIVPRDGSNIVYNELKIPSTSFGTKFILDVDKIHTLEDVIAVLQGMKVGWDFDEKNIPDHLRNMYDRGLLIKTK